MTRAVSSILDTPEQDWLHLILVPVWALALGLALGATPLAAWKLTAFGQMGSPVDAFLGTFIMAHLVIVVFRSHVDPAVRVLHPVRFWAVPPALFALLALSMRARGAAAALAIWWDVYHSSMQTFGLARIYDAKAGNGPETGRSLDWLLNVLLYAGPILCGAMLLFHASPLWELEFGGWKGAGAWVARVIAFQPHIRRYVLGAGLAFLAFYAAAYARLARRGYRAPREKTALQLGTAAVSIWAWGFNPLGMALFVMNFFHAWQYFALVWRYERENIARVLRVPAGPRGRPWAFAGLVGFGFLYGAVFGLLSALSSTALALTLVVSLMHFWYDGFVWSVRRGQV